jgi:Family of unknown function (DUF6502)
MSGPHLRSAAITATAHMLSPLVRLLLDVGIGAREFQEIARLEFVRAAVAKGAASDPPAVSNSDVAMLTGLTRRDIARLRSLDIIRPSLTVGYHRAERVLSAWCHDPEFRDERGNPARLPLRGERRSFGALVRKHSGDPRVRTLLRELERVKAVRRATDGKLEVVRRSYAPLTLSPAGIEEIGQEACDHLRTLIHNLRHPAQRLYQRRVQNINLTPSQAAILLRYLTLQADAALTALEGELNDPSPDRSDLRKQPPVRLGIGVYLFQEPLEVHHQATAADQAGGRALRKRRTKK